MMPCEPIHLLTAFLGPIGGPELIMIFVVLFLMGLPLLIVFGVLWYSKSRNNAPQFPSPPPPLPNIENRLAEIDSLRAKNLISDAEHEEKRKQILGEI